MRCPNIRVQGLRPCPPEALRFNLREISLYGGQVVGAVSVAVAGGGVPVRDSSANHA
jgi:hypothetical protein